MGFFSQECTGCERSVLNPHSTTPTNAWMAEAVTISPTGSMHVGIHDGYGNVDDAEYAIGDDNTVWHRACWEQAGRPTDYRGASPHAEDQGYFFDDADYDIPDPRLTI